MKVVEVEEVDVVFKFELEFDRFEGNQIEVFSILRVSIYESNLQLISNTKASFS